MVCKKKKLGTRKAAQKLAAIIEKSLAELSPSVREAKLDVMHRIASGARPQK